MDRGDLIPCIPLEITLSSDLIQGAAGSHGGALICEPRGAESRREYAPEYAKTRGKRNNRVRVYEKNEENEKTKRQKKRRSKTHEKHYTLERRCA